MSALWVLAEAGSAAYRVGSGRIQGGWEYVWAAYGITWTAFTLYGLYLWVKRPRSSRGSKG